MDGNTAGGSKIGAYTSNFLGNGYLAFEGYSIEYGRFDSSGYFLINATSSEGVGTGRLQVGSTNSASQLLLKSATNHVGLYASSGTDSYLSYAVGAALIVGNGPANGSTFTERARITAGGDFVVPAKIFTSQINGDGTNDFALLSNNASKDIVFYTGVGGVSAVERAKIDSSGNFSITQTPGKYTVDVTGGATSIAHTGTVDFPNASGLLVVSDWFAGNTTLWITGGGNVTLIANATNPAGSFAYNGSVNGYTWTNNSGATRTFAFFFVRTRNNG
jgi:hypothetical protein